MNRKLLIFLLFAGCFTAGHAQGICIEVYNDQNRNGIMEETETGVEGITLAVTFAPPTFPNMLPYPMFTDELGISCLINLSSGNYGFFVNLPEGYAVTNQSGPFFEIAVSEEDAVNTYRIGLNNSLAAPVHEKAVFSVYPNPAATSITFNTPEGGLVEIFDLSGKKLLTGAISANNKTIDVSSLREGLYLARLTSGIKTGCVRLVVSR